ncbi:hypothetical protein PR202_gb16507 [Eleusine coracana subsp. coracana]|uniref:Uncharacterized protein n=1 Tax=Eleusine coracana subsp. coracana TaxID=191504 RepID=A0AAV5EYB0_ELECO|nr:hypothetical protein PR202_gb16507 [Eleusine coracana subsp. coracana]
MKPEVDEPLQQLDDRPRRLYQAWKGNNVFLCGGQLILGPDAASLLITTILIVIPTIIFCYQMKSKFYHSQGRTTGQQHMHRAAVLIVILTTIMDLVFLFMTSARDPGIVPRNTRAPAEADELLGSNTPSMDWSSGRTPQMIFHRTKDVIVNGFTVKRNYRYFFLFIATSTFLCIFVFIFAWLSVYSQMTTYENFRYHYNKKENPYRKSIAANFAEVFFTKIPPSMNNFRSRVGEGALEEGFYTPYRKALGTKKYLLGGNEGAATLTGATTACNNETSKDDVDEINSSNRSSIRIATESNAASEDETCEDDAEEIEAQKDMS